MRWFFIAGRNGRTCCCSLGPNWSLLPGSAVVGLVLPGLLGALALAWELLVFCVLYAVPCRVLFSISLSGSSGPRLGHVGPSGSFTYCTGTLKSHPAPRLTGPAPPPLPPSIHVSCFPYCIRVALSSAKGFCRAWSHLQAVPGDQGSQAEVSSSLHTYENVFMALSCLISSLVVFAFLCCFVF